MTAVALDDVPGLGETRRKALLRHFGSLKRLRAATVEEITEVPGHRPAHRGGGRSPRLPPRPAASGRGQRRRPVRSSTPVTGLARESRSSPPMALPELDGRHRAVRGGPARTAGEVPGGPRLVRRRQPAAGAAPDDGRPRRRARRRRSPRIAVVVDVRSRRFFADLQDALAELDDARRPPARGVPGGLRRGPGAPLRASAPPAPAAGRRAALDGIAAERELLRDLRGEADLVIDTSGLNVHELRAKIEAAFAGDARPACGPPSCRSASSTACRSTPTSSSTAASCPTRTGCRSCGR